MRENEKHSERMYDVVVREVAQLGFGGVSGASQVREEKCSRERERNGEGWRREFARVCEGLVLLSNLLSGVRVREAKMRGNETCCSSLLLLIQRAEKELQVG